MSAHIKFWLIFILTFLIYADEISDILYYIKIPFHSSALKEAYFICLLIRPAMIIIVIIGLLCSKKYTSPLTISKGIALPSLMYTGLIKLYESDFDIEINLCIACELFFQSIPLVII
jgi:hypothetical protein